MKYTFVIQELKAGGNPNILAFLRDVEKIRKLTSKERHYLLENRHLPHATDTLVKDFIPYIIKTAYGFRHFCNGLTILDLINEGIFGAYAALNKRSGSGKRMTRYIDTYIIYSIRNAIKNAADPCLTDFVFDECAPTEEDYWDEDDFFKEMDQENQRMILRNMMEKSLGTRDAGIIYDYYFEREMNDFKKIGKKYGVGRERVRQIVQSPSKMNAIWHYIKN